MFRSTRLVLLSTWALAAVLALNLARLALARSAGQAETPRFSQTTLRPVPYLVVLRVIGDTGVPAKHSVSTMAVRSDGSSILRMERLGGTAPFSQRILRFADGRTVVTNDIQETKTTMYKATVADTLRDPKSNCLSSFSGRRMGSQQRLLGVDNVNGYRAIKISEDGATYWFVPSLSCAQVRVRSGRIANGGQDAVHVRPGEPPEELFVVPPHYREISKREMAAR